MEPITRIILYSFLLFSFTSCATFFGGNKFYAEVNILDHPDATIFYEEQFRGTGDATFKVKRKKAQFLTFTVKKDGCLTQKKTYSGIKARADQIYLNAIYNTYMLLVYPPAVIPSLLGITVDFISGALWKPDINQKGVYKINYDKYRYEINYTGCNIGQDTVKLKVENYLELWDSRIKILQQLKFLFDAGVIDQEEFELAKKNILPPNSN